MQLSHLKLTTFSQLPCTRHDTRHVKAKHLSHLIPNLQSSSLTRSSMILRSFVAHRKSTTINIPILIPNNIQVASCAASSQPLSLHHTHVICSFCISISSLDCGLGGLRLNLFLQFVGLGFVTRSYVVIVFDMDWCWCWFEMGIDGSAPAVQFLMWTQNEL